MQFSGIPQRPNPPARRVAPFGMSAQASRKFLKPCSWGANGSEGGARVQRVCSMRATVLVIRRPFRVSLGGRFGALRFSTRCAGGVFAAAEHAQKTAIRLRSPNPRLSPSQPSPCPHRCRSRYPFQSRNRWRPLRRRPSKRQWKRLRPFLRRGRGGSYRHRRKQRAMRLPRPGMAAATRGARRRAARGREEFARRTLLPEFVWRSCSLLVKT